ncbi:hypothetical protein ACIPZG_15030 [Pseudomonas sp. NPDC089395]|uniref:hypothetical protein n=1 Tax=Pseudomonas sp. NPDC089395 TaxID=3364460 RepID=UPI00381C04B3
MPRHPANSRCDIVLDYLWGHPAACILDALGGHTRREAAPRVRFVNIGAIAGATLPMNPSVLRGTGLEMLGSGLGSVSNEGLVKVVGQLLNAIKPAGMKVEAQAVPLSEVEAAWQRSTAERIVFVV